MFSAMVSELRSRLASKLGWCVPSCSRAHASMSSTAQARYLIGKSNRELLRLGEQQRH